MRRNSGGAARGAYWNRDARRHRTHGLQSASGPLDPRDPRPGRRHAQRRPPRSGRPDHRRAQRREDAGAGREARHRPLVDRPRRGDGRPQRRDLLRRRHHADARRSALAGARRRQAHLFREADLGRPRDRGRPRQEGARLGAQARLGAGQAVPAGPEEARDAQQIGLLRPDAVGALRVRLLGVRGRLGGRPAAAVLELPQGRRRRHHPRHALPLALRDRQPVRRDQVGVLPRRHAHPDAHRREPASPTRATPTTRPTPPSSSRTA